MASLDVVALTGTLAAAVVGGKIRTAWVPSVGFPAQVREFPMPPGRVVALDGKGPCALTADGALWAWTATPGREDGRWQKVADLNAEVAP